MKLQLLIVIWVEKWIEMKWNLFSVRVRWMKISCVEKLCFGFEQLEGFAGVGSVWNWIKLWSEGSIGLIFALIMSYWIELCKYWIIGWFCSVSVAMQVTELQGYHGARLESCLDFFLELLSRGIWCKAVKWNQARNLAMDHRWLDYASCHLELTCARDML